MTTQTAPAAIVVKNVQLDLLAPDPLQIRKHFDEDALQITALESADFDVLNGANLPDVFSRQLGRLAERIGDEQLTFFFVLVMSV